MCTYGYNPEEADITRMYLLHVHLAMLSIIILCEFGTKPQTSYHQQIRIISLRNKLCPTKRYLSSCNPFFYIKKITF